MKILISKLLTASLRQFSFLETQYNLMELELEACDCNNLFGIRILLRELQYDTSICNSFFEL